MSKKNKRKVLSKKDQEMKCQFIESLFQGDPMEREIYATVYYATVRCEDCNCGRADVDTEPIKPVKRTRKPI